MLIDYDQGWESDWDDAKKHGPTSRHVRRILRDMIRPLPFESVLDVGCGQGSFLQELLADFPNIRPHGVDISATAIDLARSRVPNGHFWVLDLERDSLDVKFDILVCSEVLEHLADDSSALQNLARMTGSYLIVSTVQGRMRSFEVEQVGHVRNYVRGELVRKMEAAGFRPVRVVEWGFPFYSPLYRNFLEITNAKGTTGSFGLLRRLVASALYCLFMLNSSKRGDEIFVLAEPVGDAARTS